MPTSIRTKVKTKLTLIIQKSKGQKQARKSKSAHLSRDAGWQKVVYYIFVRAGFTADRKNQASKEGVHLVSLPEDILT
jgi:hypothetical protein